MKNLMNGQKKQELLKKNVSNVFYSVNKGKYKISQDATFSIVYT